MPFAGRRDGKHFVYSHEQIMQKYQQNMRMVDRIPDALSGAMGNQMYVATFSTREGMEQFYADVLATTDDNNAAVQKELTNILALGEPETTPAEKPAAPAAKKARTTKKKVRIRSNSPERHLPPRGCCYIAKKWSPVLSEMTNFFSDWLTRCRGVRCGCEAYFLGCFGTKNRRLVL